jgi:hypothetical protein
MNVHEEVKSNLQRKRGREKEREVHTHTHTSQEHLRFDKKD